MITEFSRLTGIPELEILGKSRKGTIVEVRQMYWFVMIREGFNYSQIARLCECTHATVLHGVNKIQTLIDLKEKNTCLLYEVTKNIKR